MNHFDIIIAGYGPVGATLANLLCGKGFSIALIDRFAEVYDKPRAITVDHEAMRAWQACGLAKEISAGIGIHLGTDYVGIDGQIIKIFNPAPPPYLLGWPPAVTFVQPDVEAILRQALKRRADATEFLGYDAKLESQQDGKVSVSLTPFGEHSHAPVSITGNYLLACDGARSSIRQTCNIDVEDLGFNEWWIVLDAHIRDPGRNLAKMPQRSHQYCWPWRPGTHIIGPGTLRRWEIKLLPGETPADFASEESVKKVLAKFIDPDLIDIWRVAIYQFHAVVAQRWRNGRVFLLGDAAHQMPPFLGQGLCAGLRDAFNFAWKLGQVEKYGAPDSLLDSYETERKPHVKAVVENAKNFGLIIGELDTDRARARDAQLGAELKSGKAETIRSRFIPDLAGGLLARAGHDRDARLAQAAGSLFVQPKVKINGGDELLLDDVASPGFLLVCCDGLSGELSRQTLAKFERLGGQTIEIRDTYVNSRIQDIGDQIRVSEAGDLFANWCKTHKCRSALVRPDRYVYGVAANAEEMAQLVDALYEQLGAPDSGPLECAP